MNHKKLAAKNSLTNEHYSRLKGVEKIEKEAKIVRYVRKNRKALYKLAKDYFITLYFRTVFRRKWLTDSQLREDK